MKKKKEKKKRIGVSTISSGGRLQCPAEQSNYVVVSTFVRPSILAQISQEQGVQVLVHQGSSLEGKWRQQSSPLPRVCVRAKVLAYTSATGSTTDYKEMGLLDPLPHVLCLGHHFEPIANSTKNIIIKMPVAREKREKEKKVWTLATAPGVLCGGSLGSCDTFWAPEKAW